MLTTRLPESDAGGTDVIAFPTASTAVQEFHHYPNLDQIGSLRRED